ncbi:MAG: ferrous iron transport protein A [Sutterellaceae bacterium]|nr:ferrous iron transport protein A [Sutterellaceae bacterium]MDD7441361.1 FeoA family protein [Sutterellaceae bacterium]MDY2869162.1 FeoA family protein [Mesosutterella sp.]
MIKPLTELKDGTPGIVAAIRGDAKEVSSLKDLGIHIGAEVKVLQGRKGDSIMVAVGDTRIGVNFQMAQKILVH